ncbi:MAG: 2-amino-4-hydroxy-6-hydroxymethyldihydropteridine diphosphokinase [Bacteroidales bacterium]|nr:2-amino-4-hydroxy-6-hydroxymethyldihydropteridine diphosphokinase [Bacteroidales bacterium]MBN2757973.1 2-amino-4-hydroxy-6-hydroxymethyldihydropteridine diphosphokinase [Bacteroidales bacterium]
MHRIFLSLGSNLGEKVINLKMALKKINETIGQIKKVSSFYETEPWGFETDKWFINIVAEISTNLDAKSLLISLLEIEKEIGRKRNNNQQRYSSRLIDIDILFYDDLIIEKSNIQIPHKQLHKRIFVLNPLNEIAADFIHPILKLSISELLQKCDDKTQIKILKNVNS